MSDVTSMLAVCPPVTSPDLSVFSRVDVLGLQVNAQQVWPDKTILFCTLTVPDPGCPSCGRNGVVHDRVVRKFTHLPVGRKTTWLHVEVPRYRCTECRRLWRHQLASVARPRSKLTRAADWWALSEVVLDHCPISSVAAVLDVSWNTAHTAVAQVGTQVLINNPERLDGVQVIGVDEHCVRHEALLYRMEVEDLHGLAVVAVG